MPSQGSFPVSRLPILLLGGLAIFAPLINGGTTHLPVLIIRLTLLVAATVWIIASMKSGDHGAVEPALRPRGGLSGVGYPLHCLVSVHSDQSPVAPQPLQLCTDAVFGPAACRLSLAGSESGDSDLGDGSLRSRGGDVPISVAGQIQSHWDVLQSQLFRDLRDGHLCGRFRSVVLPGTRRWLQMGKAPVVASSWWVSS